jgi:hypothetical protein
MRRTPRLARIRQHEIIARTGGRASSAAVTIATANRAAALAASRAAGRVVLVDFCAD